MADFQSLILFIMKKISIIIPAHNEEKNIPIIYSEITELFSKSKNYQYEIIFVNDGSNDNSWNVIKKLAQKNKHVRGICFSRNFGHQVAIEAGMKNAKGDAVVMIDCDGQQPVKIIKNLVLEWGKGADIVNTIRKDTEGTSFIKRITSNLFYSLINKFSDTKIIPGAADFRLLDKKVVKVLNEFPENSKFYRGLINWIGFKTSYIDYVAKERIHGQTSYTFKKMYRFATDGLTGFSNFPLSIAKYIGLTICISGFLGLLIMIMIALIKHTYFPIWLYIIVALFVLSGLQFIVLWFIGNYIGRIYFQQKNRPTYIVDKNINL